MVWRRRSLSSANRQDLDSKLFPSEVYSGFEVCVEKTDGELGQDNSGQRSILEDTAGVIRSFFLTHTLTVTIANVSLRAALRTSDYDT